MSYVKKKLVVGSRESALAVVQAEMFIRALRESDPSIAAELLTMKTTGDRILDRRLDEIGGKGLFVKELDQSLRDGRTDLCVHSLKDLPMDTPEDLPVVGWSEREDARDVLILPAGKTEIDPSLPIGTSSKRRILQLKRLFPDARFESVRGNLQTRLRKLDEGQYGAVILAAAGVKRMGLADRISRFFSVDEVIPSAGQAILAVQGRKDEKYVLPAAFACRTSMLAAVCERAFVRALDGGCTSPIAAHAVPADGGMTLRGFYADEESGRCARGMRTAEVQTPEEAEALGIALAEELKKEANGR